MTQQGRWVRTLGHLALACGVYVSAGCQHLMTHEVDKPADPVRACLDAPPCCRDHVYVYLIHGTDPLDFANLTGLNAHLRELGYRKTYLGQLYHRNDVIRDVRHVQETDPDARFVLIGFSLGSNMARDVAHAVRPDGIQFDLLVYLGGNTLEDLPRDRPENASKLVNILAQGWIWNGTTFPDAENIHLPDVYHFGSPMHPYTRAMLARELAVVATRVPVMITGGSLPGGPLFDEPTPRPVTPTAATTPDEWDFLRPAGLFRTPESTTTRVPATAARLAAGSEQVSR